MGKVAGAGSTSTRTLAEPVEPSKCCTISSLDWSKTLVINRVRSFENCKTDKRIVTPAPEASLPT